MGVSSTSVSTLYYYSVTAVMFFYVKVLSTLLCLLLFHQNASATKVCRAGQKLDYYTKTCVDCPEKQYNPSGKGLHCENCSECRKGSRVLNKCTPTRDTRCKCLNGFTPIDQQSEICVCKKGSGLDRTGQTCSKCINGYFSDKDDSTCQNWRECKSGIKIAGTSTSDAVCKNGSEIVNEGSTIHITTLKTATISSAGPSRTMTSSSTAHSNTTASSSNKDGNFDSFWLVMLCVGILLLSGLLYHKCKITHCIHNHKKVDSRKESICRKPVEESGEKCLSLLV
ncbi:tumor necrosis factor receptor superfamily member 9 isoform X2 [Megalobrama amblycephala]|uniref:tumor necrosis factor receptor superfamily member 9 isoform X2 n=1 Tax=Megalobrama amblycephala TaxID=75352 RepID=UPI00201413DF|nr:tumor necrosis factor receptor superfamily member 9 isoform X2 [Megalobrama amblycephala]